ncbi:hypothetical protein [Bdellovibrio sp. HCB209]|uniref:hypothetical protein n=1 Tax=Bdellovibrio sp. HCB209 TaxID=3394354 RepID=UPI0039B4A9CE
MENKYVEYIYDDRLSVSNQIENIVGHRRYGEIIYKKRVLVDYVQTLIMSLGHNIRFHRVEDTSQLEALLAGLPEKKSMVFYHPAWIVPLKGQIEDQLKKAIVGKTSIVYEVGSSRSYSFHFENHRYIGKSDISDEDRGEALVVNFDEYGVNISDYGTCLSFFSGSFDARFFNQVSGDSNYVTKSSTNVEKMKAEHDYYYMLPPAMQYWFVQPFDFKVSSSSASYRMERILFADCALQWIHDAFSAAEFKAFLEKVFFFVNQRDSKNEAKEASLSLHKNLYLDKVHDRFETLKKHPSYTRLDSFIRAGTDFDGISAVFDSYFSLYARMNEAGRAVSSKVVIGHGDLCFSNILYDKNTHLLRLIDPKGVKNESERWTEPFYDVAKLSHSALGDYDWINNNLFSISIDDSLKLKLSVNQNSSQLTEKRLIFKKFLEDNGFDYYKVRFYESSLFLSMLPLHIDQEKKVMGFLLKAIEIIKELKSYEQAR